MTTRWSAIAVLLIVLSGTAPAGAAVVRTTTSHSAHGPTTTIWVEAAAGERNDLVVTWTDRVRIADSVPLEAGEGCQGEPDGRVGCDPGPGASLEAVRVATADLDDKLRIEVGTKRLPVYLDGGDGHDVLIGGGVGDNVLIGGNGNDRMVGGLGVSTFFEGAAANGSDVFDTLGPPGYGTLSYGGRVNAVHVDLDGEADDGEPGEGDRVPAGIDVFGGSGADTLVGNHLPNSLGGGPGPDLLVGRAGRDRLVGGSSMYGRRSSDDRMYGGPGGDVLVGGAGDDLLAGGSGRDDLRAFSGRDRLLLGAGRDIAWAGPGDDVLDARDRSADGVGCGPDQDAVRNDPLDWLVRCERHEAGRNRESLSGLYSRTGMPAARIRSFASRTLYLP